MKTLLILVAIIGIATVVVTIVVGTSTFEGTVVGDPYESGLRYDAQQRARAGSGWSVALQIRSFPVGTSEVAVTLTDREGAPVDDAAVSLLLGYPSSDRYDREVPFAHERNGRYRGVLELPRSGQWNVQFVVVRDDRRATFPDTIHAAEKNSTAPLTAPSLTGSARDAGRAGN